MNCHDNEPMDSINQHQPEDTRQIIQTAEAIKRIHETVEKTASCFFCTAFRIGDSVGARPMSVRKVDDRGHLWFLSASDSHKNAEIAADPSVTLYFQGSEHSDFLQLRGPASISLDKARIRALWQPAFKTWFAHGIDDPRITAIEVAPASGYYWDIKHGNAVAGIKM